MTIEELKQNKELFEQCEKEIEAKVQAGEDLVAATIEVFKAHGAEVDEDAMRAEAVEKMNLSQDEIEHVSGGTDFCSVNYACQILYQRDDGGNGEGCFSTYGCVLIS